MKHTTTPWQWKQTRGNNRFEHRIFTHHQTIADLNGENAENIKANAEYIVKAVNCHEELVEALKNMIHEWIQIVGNENENSTPANTLEKAQQALTKATK